MVIKSALVVGGGIAGMSAAIMLRRSGVEVSLIDQDPQWKVAGAGITITGPTLRALKALGVLETLRPLAYMGQGIRVCSVEGVPLQELDTPMPPNSGLPGSGGIMRPVLHQTLSSEVLKGGTQVRLGVKVRSLTQTAEAVEVAFDDGKSGRFDLVIGADGLHSQIRSTILPAAPKPEYTGQCIWRAVLPRAPEITQRHFFLGGPVKVGLNPVSEAEMYLFLLERRPVREWMTDDRAHIELAELLKPYGGVLKGVRAALGPSSRIVFRPLEAFFLPDPWYVGRVILIGDAAHPTTPQLASGAGMAIEDALVLAQELERFGSVGPAFAAFMRRRYERCRLVVENSLEIGRREQRGESVDSQTQLVQESLRALAEPF
jgi:2-polyprenyl-6-methoxyphenol hydroxylase-like FAD-dependent oxidoreductase